MQREVSDYDKDVYLKIRKNVSDFVKTQAGLLDTEGLTLLDVAPQDHAGAQEFFRKVRILTADIDEKSGADYIIDICANNSSVIPDNSFDLVLCTEVIEHTLNPFAAVKELHRLLKPGGKLLMSTPFDFRIHGPLPDCWRFTEHGLRAMLSHFEKVEIAGLENENRFLMPYHYTTVATKAKAE